MSRICVKNLSKNTSEASLRKHFSLKGEITDARIVKRATGHSRQFAFIGFRSAIQAEEAIAYFNNTFLDNSRLIIEPAKKIGDVKIDEVKSRITKRKFEKQIKQQELIDRGDTLKVKATTQTQKADKTKLDFMEAMKPRMQAQFWANDESKAESYIEEKVHECIPKDEVEEFVGTDSVESIQKREDFDDDESNDEDENDFTLVVHKPSKLKDGTETRNLEKAVTDMDYLRSKVKSHTDFTDSDSDSFDGDDDEDGQDGEDHHEEKISRINPKSSQKHLSIKKQSQEHIDDSSASASVSRRPIATADNVNMNSSTYSQPEADADTDVKAGSSVDVAVKAVDMHEDRQQEPDQQDEQWQEAVEEDIDHSRLFVRNLPYSCSEDELKELFAGFGPITETHLPLDSERKGKGFGFVQFMIPEHAESARLALDGSAFQGRLIHIINAKRPKEVVLAAASAQNGRRGPKLSAYQLKKEEARRKMAGKTDGWNASYVRSDTVIDTVAEKYGMARTDILDTAEGGGELAVRLAVAEAHVIQENREYLASRGVDVGALESVGSMAKATARSTTTLLVKNLPHDSVPDELEEMLSRFGPVASFVMPPSRSVALVDFVEPSEARNAFKGLAYRKYKHVPLYLEWAPMGVLKPKPKPSAMSSTSTGAEGSEASKGPDIVKGNVKEGKPDVGDDGVEFSSLFVKNLNFSTTEADLKEHLARLACGGLRAVSLPKKQRVGPGGQQQQQVVTTASLSMGFGFLEFRDASHAQEALRRLNGSALLGHSLEVKPSDKRISVRPVEFKAVTHTGLAGDKPSAKLVVRNVAFQTTRAELASLFSSFGSVKSVRIPKKMGGVHRGFAFVELATVQEAETAKNALANAHFYGRHLVIEWAKDEDMSLDKLRRKAETDEGAFRLEKRRRKLDDTGEDGMAGHELGGFDDAM